MSRREPRGALRAFREIGHVGRLALERHLGLQRILHRQVVGRLLVPIQRRLVAVDAKPHAVLLAGRHLRDDERGLGGESGTFRRPGASERSGTSGRTASQPHQD